MAAWKWLVAGMLSTSPALAQEPMPEQPKSAPAPAPVPPPAQLQPPPAPPQPPPAEDIPPPKAAASRISAVTVYQGTALVTREVAVPEGKGVVEVVVTPLPPRTIAGSIYAEGGERLRVLSARYRTRAAREDTRKEVRAKEDQVRALRVESRRISGEQKVAEHDLEFLKKLEGFTGVTLKDLGEKGKLDPEATIKLAQYVMDTRAKKTAAVADLAQKLQDDTEAIDFAKRQEAELAAGSSRTEIDAVIVLDKDDAPGGTVRLSYLVDSATWTPSYRFRAAGPKDPVQLESLGAIEQHSGEDWNDAALTLSTAQPTVSATLPELLPLELSVGGDEDAGHITVAAGRAVRARAGRALMSNDSSAGTALLNQAAALDQTQELLAKDDESRGEDLITAKVASVTHHLKGKRSIPSRKDIQVVEISRTNLTPEFFDRAAPVLSPQVFRLAKLTNTGDAVVLPGEASMYVGGDFVGKMNLRQVAVGEPFTVGFGVDPQLQIGRRLVKKARSIQGGNQVIQYEFRVVARNFGNSAAKLQVWDRLPKADAEAVAVTLNESRPTLSTDPLYSAPHAPTIYCVGTWTSPPAPPEKKRSRSSTASSSNTPANWPSTNSGREV